MDEQSVKNGAVSKFYFALHILQSGCLYMETLSSVNTGSYFYGTGTHCRCTLRVHIADAHAWKRTLIILVLVEKKFLFSHDEFNTVFNETCNPQYHTICSWCQEFSSQNWGYRLPIVSVVLGLQNGRLLAWLSNVLSLGRWLPWKTYKV